VVDFGEAIVGVLAPNALKFGFDSTQKVRFTVDCGNRDDPVVVFTNNRHAELEQEILHQPFRICFWYWSFTAFLIAQWIINRSKLDLLEYFGLLFIRQIKVVKQQGIGFGSNSFEIFVYFTKIC